MSNNSIDITLLEFVLDCLTEAINAHKLGDMKSSMPNHGLDVGEFAVDHKQIHIELELQRLNSLYKSLQSSKDNFDVIISKQKRITIMTKKTINMIHHEMLKVNTGMEFSTRKLCGQLDGLKFL